MLKHTKLLSFLFLWLVPALFFVSAVRAQSPTFPDCSSMVNISSLTISPNPVGINEEVSISGQVSYNKTSACTTNGNPTPINPNFYVVKILVDQREVGSFDCDFVRDACSGNNIRDFKFNPSAVGYKIGDKLSASVGVYLRQGSMLTLLRESPLPQVEIGAGQGLMYGCLAPNNIYACSQDRNSSQLSESVCGDNPVLPVDKNLCGHGPYVANACVVSGKYYCFAGNEEPDENLCDKGYGLRNDVTADMCGNFSSTVDARAEELNRGLIGKFIPGCVNETNGAAFLKSECGDVTIFLKLMINIVNYLFAIIGGVALLFFVYGGFTFILSQGNADKVQHGKSIILAAVLGIIVAFSGYALVRFVGDVVGIKSEYKLQQ